MNLPHGLDAFYPMCYATNNRFAYQFERDRAIPRGELKTMNFVPTYDPWCLFCDKKDCTKRCTKCKFVYFCDSECQRKAWPIHKRHCGRDLFKLCMRCGIREAKQRCDACPVGYCSDSCRFKIEKAHKAYRCTAIARLMK